jgi:hypothetical protein
LRVAIRNHFPRPNIRDAHRINTPPVPADNSLWGCNPRYVVGSPELPSSVRWASLGIAPSVAGGDGSMIIRYNDSYTP